MVLDLFLQKVPIHPPYVVGSTLPYSQTGIILGCLFNLVFFYSLFNLDFQGAVESLLERTSHVQLADGSVVPIDEPCKQLLLLKLAEMSSKGLRCLGLAYKDELGEFSDYYSESHPAHKKLLDPASYSSIESDLIFVGVVGLRVSICHIFFFTSIRLIVESISFKVFYLIIKSSRTLHVRKFIKQLRIVEELGLKLW